MKLHALKRPMRARRLPTLPVLFAAAMLAVQPLISHAQEKIVSLRYTANAPQKSPWGVQIERLAATVTAETKGSVKIEPFFGGQLGNEQDTLQQMARGRIDMGNFSMGAATLLVPELQVLMLPFYFDSAEQQDCVIDRHVAKTIDDLFTAKGLKLLGVGEVGVIDLASKRPLPNVTDIKGLKGTAYSKIQGMLWNVVGASSSFIGVPDWASSLQTGLIDFTTSPVSLYVPAGINKVAPVFTQLNLWHTPGLTLISQATFDKLSAKQKAEMRKAFEIEVAPKLRTEIRALEIKLRQAHVAGGGQLIELTPEQRAGWRNAVAPAWPDMIKAIGGQADAFYKAVDTARSACKS